jgi:hypothetical protein
MGGLEVAACDPLAVDDLASRLVAAVCDYEDLGHGSSFGGLRVALEPRIRRQRWAAVKIA